MCICTKSIQSVLCIEPLELLSEEVTDDVLENDVVSDDRVSEGRRGSPRGGGWVGGVLVSVVELCIIVFASPDCPSGVVLAPFFLDWRPL